VGQADPADLRGEAGGEGRLEEPAHDPHAAQGRHGSGERPCREVLVVVGETRERVAGVDPLPALRPVPDRRPPQLVADHADGVTLPDPELDDVARDGAGQLHGELDHLTA
jgi:hypothetical protein